MQQELAKWNNIFAGDTSEYAGATVYPPLNISEDENNIYVKAEIPGVTPNQPELFIEGDTLTIKGERQPPPSDSKISYHRREIEHGHYNRSINLPTKINTDSVSAKTADGILTITLPKPEEVKPKKIAVKIG